MRNLFFVILGIVALTACKSNSKSNSNTKESEDLTFNNYSNEFFSIEYPSNWDYDEEINSEFDTIPEMSKGIRTTFFPKNPYLPFHTVCVQKSAMFHCFDTPKEWRDLSVSMKNFDDQYLGTIDSMMIDSLRFGPYPASMAGFAVEVEGDTIIHKQLVVMVNKDVYYLNNSYDWNDNGTLQQFGDSILSTVRFR